jgi:hypothetical protein
MGGLPLKYRFLTVLSVAFLLWSCGLDQANGPGFNSSQTSGVSQPQPQVLVGKLLAIPVLVVPEESRQTVIQARSTIEGDGLRVADDGAVVVWPTSAATGFVVEVGGAVVNVEADGTFVVPVPQSQVSEGVIRHVTDQRYRISFPLSNLSAEPGQVSPMILQLAFQGACFMNPEDFCGPGARPAIPKELEILARAAQPTAITTGRRGTYATGLGTTVRCEDKNGYLSSPSLPAEIRYLGSTCDKYVREGACPNENFMSDIQYNIILSASVASRGLLGTLADALAGKLLSPPLAPTSVLECVDNHKGRVCQQVKIGDLSVDVGTPGTLVKPDPDGAPGFDFAVITVSPGQTLPVAVHNNGVYGITFMKKIEDRIGGTLTPNFAANKVVTLSSGTLSLPVPKSLPGPGQTMTAASLLSPGSVTLGPVTIDQIIHFDPPVRGAVPSYQTDRPFTYSVPGTAQAGQGDTYLFYVDGSYALVRFVLSGSPSASPSTAPGGVTFSPDQELQFVHQVGVTPCPQPIGTYNLSNNGVQPVTFSVTQIPSQLTVTPTSGSIAPGQTQALQVFFNCSTTSSFGPVNFTIMVDGNTFTGRARGVVQ